MVRARVILAVVALGCASSVEAQPQQLTRMGTVSIGAAHGGDTRDTGVTPSGSMAVVEDSGLGAEIDIGHTRQFAGRDFGGSSITTAMLNMIAMFPYQKVRPFGSGGVGAIRVRASATDGQTVMSRTDFGLNVGGGVLVAINEDVAIRGDVRYFRYFQRPTDGPPIDRGFFDFWRTSAGVTFSWPIQ